MRAGGLAIVFLDFYGLREQPFGVTPDPAYLYPSQTHSEALAALSAGIGEGRGFFALVAEPGMGKTTLLYRLLESLGSSARTAYLFQTQCDQREFMQYVLGELGVDTRGLGLVALHNKLNEALFGELLEGKRFVLVVDEAQNLEDSVLETVRLLSNFETTHTKLLQIVLAGQPELAVKLAQPRLLQLKQRIAVFGRLERFSLAETAAYIDHRLQVAGRTGDPLFTPEALEAIAAATGGIPRNINSLCFQTLSLGCERGLRPVTEEVVRAAAAKLGMESFAGVTPHVMAVQHEAESAPTTVAAQEISGRENSERETPYPGTLDRASLTYGSFAYASQSRRRRWMYPAVAIGILAVLAISIPTLLRIAGPGLTSAAPISKQSQIAPTAAQSSAYAPEFGPATYSASPSDTGDRQVLTVVALPQQTLRDIILQHGGRFDEETVKEIRALNPQLNPDQIDPGQLIRIPQPAGTWKKSFDSSDTGETGGAGDAGNSDSQSAPKPQPAAPQPKPQIATPAPRAN